MFTLESELEISVFSFTMSTSHFYIVFTRLDPALFDYV